MIANVDHQDSEQLSGLPGRTGCTTTLRTPYVIFFGSETDRGFAKTGLGLIQWRPEHCVGQIRHTPTTVDGGIPDVDVSGALAAGARSLILGVAPSGGGIEESWLVTLSEAVSAGLDIVSGMHIRLGTIPELRSAVTSSDARLVDVRTPPDSLPVGTGKRRPGRRILTVGTDCAVGKKYTALAIERELKQRGLSADFRATGQTGIMIAGTGVPVDAVVSDFISGAVEVLAPAARPDHWDVIEGQGALTNPSYSGVSLGLLHGAQADALVLCHDPKRTHHLGAASSFPLVSLSEAMEINLMLARRVNPEVHFVGVSLNTHGMSEADRQAQVEQAEAETGLPAVDPIVHGVAPVVDRLLSPAM